MSADSFFDSNILLYALSAEAKKQARADELINRGGVISVQVLNEFANVASKKLGFSIKEIRETLSALRKLCTVKPLDIEIHELGLDIAERFKFSIYESMLVAAALKAGCRIFWSEDLKHGQTIEGLTIQDPFRGP